MVVAPVCRVGGSVVALTLPSGVVVPELLLLLLLLLPPTPVPGPPVVVMVTLAPFSAATVVPVSAVVPVPLDVGDVVCPAPAGGAVVPLFSGPPEVGALVDVLDAVVSVVCCGAVPPPGGSGGASERLLCRLAAARLRRPVAG